MVVAREVLGSNAVSVRPSSPTAKMISGTEHLPKSPMLLEELELALALAVAAAEVEVVAASVEAASVVVAAASAVDVAATVAAAEAEDVAVACHHVSHRRLRDIRNTEERTHSSSGSVNRLRHTGVADGRDARKVSDDTEHGVERIGLATRLGGHRVRGGLGGRAGLLRERVGAARVRERVADELRDDVDVLRGACVRL